MLLEYVNMRKKSLEYVFFTIIHFWGGEEKGVNKSQMEIILKYMSYWLPKIIILVIT